MYIGPIPPKRKSYQVAIIGRIWVLPRLPVQMRLGMALMPPRTPTHLAISLNGGPRQIVEVERA